MNKKQKNDATEALNAFLSREDIAGLPDDADAACNLGVIRAAHKALDETRKVGVIKRLQDDNARLEDEVQRQTGIANEAQREFHHAEKGRAEDAAELARLREMYPVLERQLEAVRDELRKVRNDERNA